MRKVCGLDVHKDSVFVCILSEKGEKIQSKFGVLTSELDKMRDLLIENGVGSVCMERTSIYWIPIWRVLESDIDLKLVNPYFIKQLPGKKSDVKDAEWIATCLMKDLIRGSYIPGSLIQQLRQYDRRSSDLSKEIAYKLTKLDTALQRCNIRISNYVSSTDSKSYKAVVDLIAHGVTNPEILTSKIHTRTINRVGREVIKDSLTGVIRDVDCEIIEQLKQEVDLAQKHKDACLDKMAKICKEHFSKEMEQLQSIPGVGEQSATTIIAELGTDMKTFPKASSVVAWAGLKPRNEESAGKIKSTKTLHGNKYLRKALIECSWAASKKQGCFFNRYSYHQVMVRHKNRQKVQTAIARKILVVIWNLFTKGEMYRDYIDYDQQLPVKNG